MHLLCIYSDQDSPNAGQSQRRTEGIFDSFWKTDDKSKCWRTASSSNRLTMKAENGMHHFLLCFISHQITHIQYLECLYIVGIPMWIFGMAFNIKVFQNWSKIALGSKSKSGLKTAVNYLFCYKQNQKWFASDKQDNTIYLLSKTHPPHSSE